MQIDLKKFPTASGVYLMKGEDGAVLYVGKAKNLRTRLRSYFSARGDGRAQIRFLMARLQSVETIVTDTEQEALILENTLIKKYRPRYNLHLRDDKTYASLRLDPREEFPALQLVRKVRRDGAVYFGPFSSAAAVRDTLKEIYRIFPLRHHPLADCRRRARPCLFYQIGQCSAPCHGKITAAEYHELVKGVIALLSGRETEVLEELQRRMAAAAAELRFEEAGRLRDQIAAIGRTVEGQKVVAAAGGDEDVVGLHRQEGEVEISLLFVRGGKLIGRRCFGLEWQLDEDELLSAFLQQFYGREVFIPDLLLVPLPLAESASLEAWLTERKGKAVRLRAPQRGARKKLLELAERNARESFRERGGRQEARQKLLAEVQARLQLPRFPRRMECFDISHVQGQQSVGSMAVVIDGEADHSAYRHFRLRSVSGGDDYGALDEILRRRLQRGLKSGDLPDFILIDGGKGQLSVLAAVLHEFGLTERIGAAGIAKSRVLANLRGRAVERSEERFFLVGRKNPVTLRQGSPALFLLERLRDEAHRFAITYHRTLRSKASLHSSLETIPGIGPTRRKALLKHFGSLKQIKAATCEELQSAGVPAAVAAAIHGHFHGE